VKEMLVLLADSLLPLPHLLIGDLTQIKGERETVRDREGERDRGGRETVRDRERQ
jgi:hypothetical protein